MSSKWVHAVLVCLIALAVVPFGMNAFGAREPRPIDPMVFRFFLATSVIAWTTLVMFSTYLSVKQHALANFAWISVVGVFGSFLAINLIFSTLSH